MTQSRHFSKNDMDRIAQSENYMAPIFEKVARERTYEGVLDVGCGNGFFAQYLKKLMPNTRFVGVDGSEYGLAEARVRGFDETHLVSDFCASPLPCADKSFDLVLCKDVLEHLMDPLPILREISRVMKRDGMLFVLVPNHFPLFYRFKFLFENRIDTQSYFPEANEWDLPHVRFFTNEGLSELLNRAGFKEISRYSRYFPCMPGFGKLPGGKAFTRYMANKNPTQFSTAYALLLTKC